MRHLTVQSQKIQKPVNFSSGITKRVLFYVLYKLPFLKWPNLAARINIVHLTLLEGLRRLNLIMLAQVIMRVSICNQTVPRLLQHWSNQQTDCLDKRIIRVSLSVWPEHVATPYSLVFCQEYCFFQAIQLFMWPRKPQERGITSLNMCFEHVFRHCPDKQRICKQPAASNVPFILCFTVSAACSLVVITCITVKSPFALLLSLVLCFWMTQFHRLDY